MGNTARKEGWLLGNPTYPTCALRTGNSDGSYYAVHTGSYTHESTKEAD